jgi:hypothetical protein
MAETLSELEKLVKYVEIIEARLPLGKSVDAAGFNFGFEAEFLISEGYIHSTTGRDIDELVSDEGFRFLQEYFKMPDIDSALEEFADESGHEAPTPDDMLNVIGARDFLKRVDATLINPYHDRYDAENGQFSRHDKSQRDVYYDVVEELREIGINPQVFNEDHQRPKNFKNWYLEPDQSVKGTSDSDYDAELTSPVFDSYEECLARLESVLGWIGQEKEDWMYTNGTCGLHINIGPPKSFDPLKFIVFAGEQYLAKLFPRSNASSTAPLIPAIHSQSPAQFQQNFDRFVEELVESMSMNDDKMFLVNFLPWFEKSTKKPGYVEVRAIGGANYEKRFVEIKQHVDRLLTLFMIAADPSMYRNEYMKKVYRHFINPNDDEVGAITQAARLLTRYFQTLRVPTASISNWIKDGRVIADPRMVVELLMNVNGGITRKQPNAVAMPSATLKLVCREIGFRQGMIEQIVGTLSKYIQRDYAADVAAAARQLKAAALP